MLEAINKFLGCATPKQWVTAALAQQDILLIDHAHCEKKAASTALSLMYRYVERPTLLQKMSRLAREELRHFEKVLSIMTQRNIDYTHLSPARYAEGLRQHMTKAEPGRLIDVLIIGAYIEARSCERFAVLIPHLDNELADFYRSLLKSEARHYQDYLHLAEQYADHDITERVRFFGEVEAGLINSPDEQFRFHSGIPITN